MNQDGTTERALANRIGILRRSGDPTGWWQDRPRLRQLLADLLELEEHDIFKSAAAERGAIVFREFPALPALEPDERPCHLGPDGNTYEQVLAALRARDRGWSWFKVPPGGGKSLTIELLRARHRSEAVAVSVRSLPELLGQPDGRPLIAEVEARHRDSDRDALDALRRRSHTVIVLAPFDSPERTNALSVTSWLRRREALAGDWLSRMLRWIAERLERSPRDTKLDFDEVLAWIHESEERERLIRTPGDLLALCADFDQFGTHGPLAERTERWLAAHGSAWLPGDAAPTWRANAALDSYRAIVRAELLDVSIALGHRPLVRWAELLPDRLDPGLSRGAPGREMVIAYLAQAGLLRGGEHGLEPYPHWVGHGIAHQELQSLFKSAPPERWGALAADESRRSVVDGALDELSDLTLRVLRRRVLSAAPASSERTSLGQIGAVEATLAVTARRIADRLALAAEDDPQELQQLLVAQLRYAAISQRVDKDRVPLTRRDHDEWFATGWAISLFTPPPASFDLGDLRWILPGWAPSLRLDEQRIGVPSSGRDPWGANASVQRLVRLAPRLLERLEPGAVPDHVPRVFLPALFLSPSAWQVTGRYLNVLAGSWEELFLVREANRRAQSARSAVAQKLWRALGDWLGGDTEAPVALRIEYVQEHCRFIARFVLDNVPAGDIQETARIAGIGQADSGGVVRALPPASRTAALRGWLQKTKSRSEWLEDAREIVSLVDAVDLEILLEDLRHAEREAAWRLTPFVWHEHPDRALGEARAALAGGLPLVEDWFNSAPREHLGDLADVLQRADPRPAWAARWALRRLLEAGPAAEQLLALARAGAAGTPSSDE